MFRLVLLQEQCYSTWERDRRSQSIKDEVRPTSTPGPRRDQLVCCKKPSFFSMRVCICVFVAINIAQQSKGPELSYLFMFISMWLLSCFLCWSLMDHHANVLSPIIMSLWMLLSLRYEGLLCKGQQHSRGPKLDNSQKHRISTIVNKALMNFSFFSTTLDLHHQIPFSAHFLSCLLPLPCFVIILLNAPLIFAITLNLLC
jgi:hypothetical protein